MRTPQKTLVKLWAYTWDFIRNLIYRERWRQFRENAEEDDPYD